ncbi:MAG: hypothetical protein K0R55_3138 [Sporomusa sp.]|jgi:hypothetical protein|nr:hypothetical protein [Sporomusa sp.]
MATYAASQEEEPYGYVHIISQGEQYRSLPWLYKGGSCPQNYST